MPSAHQTGDTTTEQPDHVGRNMLFILSDEHNRNILGCHGHPFVQTPNLDRLAEQGARFDAAYCNSPICVPSRASLATGRHVHDIGNWDNAHPYRSEFPSWHSHLRERGVHTVSIGKLHFRGGDDYGFSEELIPLHVLNGKGDLKGLFRKDPLPKKGTRNMAEQAGAGPSSYSDYDARISQTACDWLKNRAQARDKRRFMLFVSFVMPHFPLIAPEDCYALYDDLDLETLQHGLKVPTDDHPTLNHMRQVSNYDDYFTDETRAIALKAYFGMVTRLDQLIGNLLETLEDTGFAETTSVIYSSDHGDNLGRHGLWGKSVMYESAAAVPMIVKDPAIAPGTVVTTPVSLIDIAPTISEVCGCDLDDHWSGESLISVTKAPDPERSVFSQYHAVSSDTGMFMIRKAAWKYIYYAGSEPQLFNLDDDPDETDNLANVPRYVDVRRALHQELRKYCDPEEVNATAFADQATMIAANGGRAAIAASTDIPFTPAPK